MIIRKNKEGKRSGRENLYKKEGRVIKAGKQEEIAKTGEKREREGRNRGILRNTFGRKRKSEIG